MAKKNMILTAGLAQSPYKTTDIFTNTEQSGTNVPQHGDAHISSVVQQGSISSAVLH
jgi:hypothetical protein